MSRLLHAGESEESEARRRFNKFCSRTQPADGSEPKHYLTYENFVALLAHYEAAPSAAVPSYFYALDRAMTDIAPGCALNCNPWPPGLCVPKDTAAETRNRSQSPLRPKRVGTHRWLKRQLLGRYTQKPEALPVALITYSLGG